MRLRRRVADLEQRLAAIEARTTISYDMPPAPAIDMDPRPPLTPEFPPPPKGADWDDEDEEWTTTGVYL